MTTKHLRTWMATGVALAALMIGCSASEDHMGTAEGSAGHTSGGGGSQQGGSGGSDIAGSGGGGVSGSGGNGTAGQGGSGGSNPNCGSLGQPCCGDTCPADDATCVNGSCVKCGGKEEPCCDGDQCDENFTCAKGQCTCGAEGQACCAGVACGLDLSCVNLTCTCENHCNADNTRVEDCHGAVVQACKDGEQCRNGICFNPCATVANKMTSVGCDFWSIKTDLINEGDGACFAAFIANTWNTPVKINVEYKGQSYATQNFAYIPKGQGKSITYTPYDPNVGLPPGEVAILFLSRGNGPIPACPKPPAISAETAVKGTGKGTAFHITTDRPVAAYQILPYGGGTVAATSATLLLPTNVWDTNYLAVNAYKKSAIVGSAFPSLDILAQQDGTQVTIMPGVAIQGGNGVSSGAQGQPYVVTLNKGQYLQISQTNELTGSPVKADKPIAVFGAASCLNVPVNQAACDGAHQQIPPIRAWGHTYVGVRYRGRAGHANEAPPWRVIGGKDGTTLTWLPSTPAGAPTSLSAGQVVEFNSAGPFVVSSQDKDHPFYLASYMTGGEPFGGEGDPEWVNVTPAEQFLNEYVLFTDPTYPETELLVVRVPDSNGNFADVNLDCRGPITGWQAVGKYEWARVDLVTGNFTNVGGCSNGRQHMSSTLPFGVTVWGWGSAATGGSFFDHNSTYSQYVSYAYPAGAAVRRINGVQ